MFLSFYDMQASMSHRFEHQSPSADCGRHLPLMLKAEERQCCNDNALAPLCKGLSKISGFYDFTEDVSKGEPQTP